MRWLRTALTGGATSLLVQTDLESPERLALRSLLETSTRNYELARNMIHSPWRYDEAHPLLDAALDAVAQVWLRLRGVHSLEKSHHTWAFIACNVRDSISGAAWNQAGVACRLLSQHCDHMGEWSRKRDADMAVRSIIRSRARAELIVALDNVTQCIECTRMVLEQRRGAFPPLPAAPRH